MAIQLKRCTTEERLASTVVLANGQPLYDTDLRVLYIGDGVTSVKDLQPIGTANLSSGDGVASVVMKTGNDPEVDYVNIAQGPANFAVGDGNKIYDTLNASGKTGTKKNFVSGTQNELGVDGTYLQVNSNLVSGQINKVGINGTTSANIIGGYTNIIDQGSYNIVSGHGNKLKTKLDDYEYSYAAASNKSILSGEYNKGYYLLDSIVSGNANDVRYVDSSLVVGKSNTITRSTDVSESNVALTAVAPVYVLGSNNNDTANTRTGRFKYWILGDNNTIKHDNVIVIGKNNTSSAANQLTIGHGDVEGNNGYIRFTSPIYGAMKLGGDINHAYGSITTSGSVTTNGTLTCNKGASFTGGLVTIGGANSALKLLNTSGSVILTTEAGTFDVKQSTKITGNLDHSGGNVTTKRAVTMYRGNTSASAFSLNTAGDTLTLSPSTTLNLNASNIVINGKRIEGFDNIVSSDPLATQEYVDEHIASATAYNSSYSNYKFTFTVDGKSLIIIGKGLDGSFVGSNLTSSRTSAINATKYWLPVFGSYNGKVVGAIKIFDNSLSASVGIKIYCSDGSVVESYTSGATITAI